MRVRVASHKLHAWEMTGSSRTKEPAAISGASFEGGRNGYENRIRPRSADSQTEWR
jgi:hypothetical protein